MKFKFENPIIGLWICELRIREFAAFFKYINTTFLYTFYF